MTWADALAQASTNASNAYVWGQFFNYGTAVTIAGVVCGSILYIFNKIRNGLDQ
jgi:hypothetical protein